MGKSFSFDLDISATTAQLVSLRSAMVDGSHSAVDEGGKVLERFIQAAAPHKSGRLRESVTRFPATRVGSTWQERVGPVGVPYAVIREFGGHISAKNVTHLKFTSDGGVHFPRTVYQKGSHYIEAGARLAHDPIRDVMVAALDAVIESVTG